MKFFEAIANVFRIPDLRKRVLFTWPACRVPPGRRRADSRDRRRAV